MAVPRLRVVRRIPAPGRSRRGSVRATAVAVVVVAGTVAAPALAASSGSVVATVNTVVPPPPPIKSVTVSTSALSFINCSGGSSTPTQLGFPSGQCNTAPVTVTNGPAASLILLTVGPFIPGDGGTPWTNQWAGLPNPPPAPSPGQDQFFEGVGKVGSTGVTPIASGIADPTLDTGGTPAPAGASSGEAFLLLGPTSSTDPSSQFTQTLTWTAS